VQAPACLYFGQWIPIGTDGVAIAPDFACL
jgi:hypothetical protein